MKKTAIITLFCLLLGLAGSRGLLAQENKQLSLTVMNESIAFPFTGLVEFHPGFEVGVPLLSNEKGISTSQINAYVGWFLHKHIENSFYLRAEYMHTFKIGSVFRAGMYGGAGYMHAFYHGTLLEIDPESGAISGTRQYGRPRALVSTGIMISAETKKGINPFIKQEFSVETPFANGVPIMPHSFLKLGFTLNI